LTVSQANARGVPAATAGPGHTGFRAERDESREQQPVNPGQVAAVPLVHPAVPGGGGYAGRQDDPEVGPLTTTARARPGDMTRSVIAGGLGEPELGFIAAGLPRRAGGRRVLQATYPGAPESVRVVRHQAAEALAGIPCGEDVMYALSEVATNAVVHSRSGQDGGEFTVAVDVFPGLQVAFTVTDQGGPWQEGGPDFYLHGLGIVREMAAAVRIGGDQDGRTVRVSFGWEARK
jgi:serine/threonine-protein kinase RsbW